MIEVGFEFRFLPTHFRIFRPKRIISALLRSDRKVFRSKSQRTGPTLQLYAECERCVRSHQIHVHLLAKSEKYDIHS